jgi:hypothetical protein
MRFRHTAYALEKGMLWRMQNDGFLPVTHYPGLTQDNFNPSLVRCCYDIYLERLALERLSPSAPWIPMSEQERSEAERFVRAVIRSGIAKLELITAKLEEEAAWLKKR